jgi:hypothetical protein
VPLYDLFNGPLGDRFFWQSLYCGWGSRIADLLNERWLSREYLAVENYLRRYNFGLSLPSGEEPEDSEDQPGGDRGRPPNWPAHAPACTSGILFPDRFEVHVHAGGGGWHLVAAIALVCPTNKESPEERRAFAGRCAAYLHQGTSVVMIDVVTNRRANLHNEILRMLNVTDPRAFLPEDLSLYTAAYRPAPQRGESPELDVWHQPCEVGEPLPTMPLRLVHDRFVPVDFEMTYTQTLRNRRMI